MLLATPARPRTGHLDLAATSAPAPVQTPNPGSHRRTPHRRALTVLVLLLGAVLATVGAGRAQDEPPVLVVDISGEIDLGLVPFVDRAVEDAVQADAEALIVRIDTPGGRLDAALELRSTLLGSPVPTVAFVDREAFSAGALIAIATEQIYYAPGGVMGAATPVDGGTGAPADEKVISAVRSTFRATAVERGRDPDIAAAMVDADLEVEGVVEAGKLLTLTAGEALEVGFAEGTATDLDDLLAQLELDDRPVIRAEQSFAESLVRFVTNPVLASLLITVGIYLVIGDLLSGGIGAAAGIGVSLLAVFFWGHLLAGLTGWEDIALVALGVVLLLVELLVVPGFGIFGVLGLAGVLGGAFLAMVNRDFDFVGTEQLMRAGGTIAASFVTLTVAVVLTIMALTRRQGPPGLVLRTQLGSGAPVTERTESGWLRWFGDSGGVLESDRIDPPAPPAPAPTTDPQPTLGPAPGTPGTEVGTKAEAKPETAPGHAPEADAAPTPRGRPSMVGAVGVALSDLRPAGIAEVAGERLDVVTEGDYLGVGTKVQIIRDEGYRRVVRRLR